MPLSTKMSNFVGMKYQIKSAKPEQAAEIATLIMEAMDADCCQNFAGPHHTLADFHRLITRLVGMEETQYSYQNTLTAMQGQRIVGIITGYDGKDLQRLRKAFIDGAKQEFGRDFSKMDDETQAGEYYIDSLAVRHDCRRQGIASALLKAFIEKHGDNQPIGLLVDITHPKAEQLYLQTGFVYKDDAMWGGHAMRHLQYPVKCAWCRSDKLSESYHDTEWGVPVHDEKQHFMFLLMEAMSCGLSWKMMLERREVFRKVFADFDASKVAAFGEGDVQRELRTEGMIRSERKIRGMIANAQAFVKVAKEFGSFDSYIWSFTQGRSWVYPTHQKQWVTRNELSDRVAKDMKQRGFCYVGSTIIYSHLQAIGVINDHKTQCFRYRELLPLCTVVDGE